MIFNGNHAHEYSFRHFTLDRRQGWARGGRGEAGGCGKGTLVEGVKRRAAGTFPVDRRPHAGVGGISKGPNPGAQRTWAGCGPGWSVGGRLSGPLAGIRMAPVPGSCRQALPSANDFSSHTKSIQ